jgi:hypothetical protein
MLHDLELFLRQLTNAERAGGRLVHIGASQLALHDCMRWSHSFTDAVHTRFPDVLIDVRASRASLSGFVVFFTLSHEAGRVRAGWYLAIALGLTVCAYRLAASPWWGAYQWIQGI